MLQLHGVIPSGRPANRQHDNPENRAGPRQSLGQSLPRHTLYPAIKTAHCHRQTSRRGGRGAPAGWRLSSASHITSCGNVPLLQNPTLLLLPSCISLFWLWDAFRLLFLLPIALVWRTMAPVSWRKHGRPACHFRCVLGTLRLDQGTNAVPERTARAFVDKDVPSISRWKIRGVEHDLGLGCGCPHLAL